MLFTHLFGNTGYNIMLRHAAFGKKTDSIFLAAVLSTAIAVPAIPGMFIAKVDLRGLDARETILFIAAVALIALFHIANSKALEYTEASIFAFLYNFRIGIVTVLGIIFLAETTQPLNIMGGALVFIAGFLLIGQRGASRKGVLWSMLAAVLISLMNLVDKILITEIGWARYMFASAIFIMCLLWVIVIASKRPVSAELFKEPTTKWLLIFRAVSAYSFTLALGFGALLSISTYISALTCITSAIAGIIFLKERDSLLKKTIAGVIAFAGITFITM